jgi:hypothetical protein
VRRGADEINAGKIFPRFPSSDPRTWEAGGALRTSGGVLKIVFSPFAAATEHLIEDPVTQLTGNPDIGSRAGVVANAIGLRPLSAQARTMLKRERPPVAEDNPAATSSVQERAVTPSIPEAPPSGLAVIGAPPRSRGFLFDYSHLHEVPPVEQYNLARYQLEHGVPDHIRALDNPEKLNRLDAFARIGLERGGHKSLNMEPFREHYMAELGLEKGQAGFKQFTDLLGAVSSVSTDLATLRNASYYDWLIKQGYPLPAPIWDPVRRKLVLPEPLPYPYGHFKQGLHAQKVNEVVEQGGLDSIKNGKLAAVAAGFSGNFNPFAFDRHVVRTLRATDSRGRPIDLLPPAGHAFMEPLLQERAARMDLAPAQYQGAIRFGAAKETGLRSFDPMLVNLDKRLGVTGDYHGISKAEVLKQLIRNGFPLRSLGIVTGAGTAARQGTDMEEEID